MNVIVTDTGSYAPPAHMTAAFNAAKLRKDRQPDRRTKAGKCWYRLFKQFSDEKLQEYIDGR